jgi:transposase
MNKTLPVITESAEELKKRMRQAEGVQQQRLQVLYLLASEQAPNRSQVARLMGLHRNTVQNWLAAYADGGLAQMLQVEKAPGRQPALAGEKLAQLRAKLAEPAGFASYGEVRTWIEGELGVAMQYEAVRKLVRYRLGAKLKRARPSHIKKQRGREELSNSGGREVASDGT